MAEAKIYIDDKTDSMLREHAMKRFGYGRGSISKAAEEAILRWLARMDEVQGILSSLVNMAAKDKQVVAVLIFGSYARKEPTFRDVDIGILVRDNSNASGILLRYNKELSAHEHGIDICIINSMPLNIQSIIFNEGVPIYIKDKQELYTYSADLITRWSDFKPTYELAIEA